MKIWTKKQYMEDVKKACKELKEIGYNKQGQTELYFKNLLNYKATLKDFVNYPV